MDEFSNGSFSKKKAPKEPSDKGSKELEDVESKSESFGSEINKKIKLNSSIAMVTQSPNLKQHQGFQQFQAFSIFQQTPQKKNQFSQNSDKLVALDRQKEQQTPATIRMCQYQWIKTVTTEHRHTLIEDIMNNVSQGSFEIFQENITQKIEQVLQTEENPQTKASQVKKFFFCILGQMILAETKGQPESVVVLLQNGDLICALLAITIETYQFVYERPLDFPKLLEICGIQPVELWRIISNFAGFSDGIPESVTKHLFELESRILLCDIWKSQSEYILDLIKKRQEKQHLRYFEGVLLGRVQSHFALRVKELSSLLQISDQYKESVWQSLAKIIEDPPNVKDIFKDKHIDTLILSIIYMILKKNKFEPEFKKFRELYDSKFPAEQASQVFYNLVKFYNDTFLPNFKKFVQQTITPQSQTPQPKLLMNQQYKPFCSPMEQLIPKPFLHQSPILQNSILKEQLSWVPPKSQQLPLDLGIRIQPFNIEFPLKSPHKIIGQASSDFRQNLAGRIKKLDLTREFSFTEKNA